MPAKRTKVRCLDYNTISEITKEAFQWLKVKKLIPDGMIGVQGDFRFYEGQNRIDNITYHKEFDPKSEYGCSMLYGESFVEITGILDILLNKLIICADKEQGFIDQVVTNLHHRIDYLLDELREGRDKTISNYRIDKITYKEQWNHLKELRKSIVTHRFKIEKFDYKQIEITPEFIKPLDKETGFIKIGLKVKDGEEGEIIDLVSSQKSNIVNEPPSGRIIDANYIACIFYMICKSKGISISGRNDRESDLFAQIVSRYFFRNRESDALHNLEFYKSIEFDMSQLEYLESICRKKSKPIQEATIMKYFKSTKRFNFIGTKIPLNKRFETIKSICSHKSFKTSPSFQRAYKLFLADPNEYLGIHL